MLFPDLTFRSVFQWSCQFFGYQTCSEISTFEALMLFGMLVLLARVVTTFFLGLFDALNRQ